MQVKLTSVTRSDQFYTDKRGQKYIRIKINLEGDSQEYSGLEYENSPCRQWKAGDTVELDVSKNGEYWNFNMPKKSMQGLDMLTARVKVLEDYVKVLAKKVEVLEFSGKDREAMRIPTSREEREETIPF